MHRWAITFGVLAAVGCAGAPSSALRPDARVAELATALRGADPSALASLTGRTEAELVASEATNGRELEALGETLRRAPVEHTARVVLLDGGAIALVRDGESWRVDRGVLGRPALTRPIDAVVAFHDALARSRLGAVLSLLSHASRAELELQLSRWLDGTADPDAVEITVQGESATAIMPTGERLELVRESGEWHVLGL